jgi:hypothetical protein
LKTEEAFAAKEGQSDQLWLTYKCSLRFNRLLQEMPDHDLYHGMLLQISHDCEDDVPQSARYCNSAAMDIFGKASLDPYTF